LVIYFITSMIFHSTKFHTYSSRFKEIWLQYLS